MELFPGVPRRSMLPRILLLLPWIMCALARPAQAVPSFAVQTGQPCSACHVDAFGPQLKPFGRDFKLYGYTATDGKPWRPPIAMTAQVSFTNPPDAQPGGAARWYAPNNNVALDQASLYYAGRIEAHTGAFFELMYDGIGRKVHPGNIDIRHARDFSLLGFDAVGGVTVNNTQAVQDLWNTASVWGFPYNSSALAPTPGASAIMDRTLGQRVAGIGLYALWNDVLYTEVTAYRGIGRDVPNAAGEVPVSGAIRIDGFAPYWRVALQKDLERHFFQVGTYGLNANIFPNGDKSAGISGSFTDVAADASFQFIVNPKSVVSDMLSLHTILIHEMQSPGASSRLAGSNGYNTLDTFRIDASYSFNATITPSIQYFRIAGSADAVQYGWTGAGRTAPG